MKRTALFAVLCVCCRAQVAFAQANGKRKSGQQFRPSQSLSLSAGSFHARDIELSKTIARSYSSH
jgi:hypothetical protein